MSKKEALKGLGAPEGSTFEQTKKVFRRQAMKWHPDRNSSLGAEARFKSIRAHYEWLEELHNNGSWDQAEADSTLVAEANKNEEEFEADAQKQAQKPAPWRKTWDPTTGPLFDVGYGTSDPIGSAIDFFDSFMNTAQHFLSSGASVRMAATVLARGFHGYMTEMAFDIRHVPILKVIFLKKFWARRIPGVLEALNQAREKFMAMGWATTVGNIIEPKTEIHIQADMSFYIFNELACHLPSGRPSEADIDYYKQCVTGWPELFEQMAHSECRLRWTLKIRGLESGPRLMESVLEVCPQLLEIWGPLGTPKDWGAQDDWLGSALASGVSPMALISWAQAESLSQLCARLTALHAQPRTSRWRALHMLASKRMEEQSDWSGAGPWAGANDALLGRAQGRLEAARKKLKVGVMGAVTLGLGLASLSVGQKTAREVIFGDPEKTFDTLSNVKRIGRLKESLSFERAPIAALCAMRGFFEVQEPLDFYVRAKGIELVAGIEQLARRDPDGLTAMDWFERAIERRKVLGIS